MSFLLTPYHLAREVYFVYYGRDNAVHPNARLVKPLKLTNAGFVGRIKNRRFVLPASLEALQMTLDEYSERYIVRMLHERGLLTR